MAFAKHAREYDIVLVGATGYTGVLTALAVAEQLPTDLKWAVAGRSQSKLQQLTAQINEKSPDRVQPAIETAALDQLDQVAAVVKKAKVCISTVLYHAVGDVVVQACAENGTDYIDCFIVTSTGNVAQVGGWISKYHETANANSAAIIVASGFFSAPQDLVAWAAATALAKQVSLKTKEVILTYPTPTPIEASGGTVESIGSVLLLDPAVAAAAAQPWYLSPIRGVTPATAPVGVLGTRHDAELGVLADSSHGDVQNRAFIHRSWALLGGSEGYGPRFWFSEYETASSTLDAAMKVLSKKVIGFLLSSSFLYNYILRPLFPAAGDGPDTEAQLRDRRVFVKAIAVADDDDANTGNVAKSLASFEFPGGSYRCTAVLLAQGAASLLYARKLGHGHQGGILTPACLGQDYVDRMEAAGAKFETRLL
ncbi:putative trans-acting enoyl reductase [Paramyrothecium foliicola]|nr:putative trans-acting enoyl reductase [Paramyrothecium foliicola]